MIHFLIQTGALTACKNLIDGILIGTTTLFTNPTAPTRPHSFDASVYVTQQGKVRLGIEKKHTGNVSVTLTNRHSDVLYQVVVPKKQLKTVLQFDISNLEDGTYTLAIQSADGSISREVNVTTKAAQVAERTIAML